VSPEPASEKDSIPEEATTTLGNNSASNAQETSSVPSTEETEEETEKEPQSEDVKAGEENTEEAEAGDEAAPEEENQSDIAAGDAEGADTIEKEQPAEEEASPIVASHEEAAPEPAEDKAPAAEEKVQADEKVSDGSLKATALLDITVIEEQTETASDAAILEAASSTADVELEAALNEIEEIPPESVQEILQSVRDGIAEENDKDNLLKAGGSKGWCCYLILAFLVALIAVVIGLAIAHREDLQAFYYPPPVVEEEVTWRLF